MRDFRYTDWLTSTGYGLFGDTPQHGQMLVLSGGGIDSFVAAALYQKMMREAQKPEQPNYVLTIDYAQDSRDAEIEMARRQARYFVGPVEYSGIEDTHIIMQDPFTTHALADRSDALKNSAQQSTNDDYVPYRNGRFLALAASVAEQYNISTIIFGAVGAVNIDNSYNFVEQTQRAFAAGSRSPPNIYAPFVMLTKAVVARVAQELNLLNYLGDNTVSCFNSTDVFIANDESITDILDLRPRQCGRCRSCTSLKQAFAFANVPDPYAYKE